MTKRELTPIEQTFVREYIRTGVGKEAAIRAGYKPSNAASQASRKLKETHIQAAIDEARKDAARTLGIDTAWVLMKSIDVVETCSQKVAVLDNAGNIKLDPNGKPVYKMVDAQTARSAISDIAGWIGVGEEQPAHDISTGVLQVPAVSTEEEWKKNA